MAAAVSLLASACQGPDAPRSLAPDQQPQAPAAAPQGARVALVLSSGGLRGLAHVGVLRALQAHGMQPDLIVGTSIGALVGAFYAAGASGEIWLARPIPDSLDPWGSWLVSPAKRAAALESFMLDALGERRIETLPRRFVAVATERRAGCVVLFGAGDLARAVLASSALPGAMAPVAVNGVDFADGGLGAPLPVRLARVLGARRVIAVDTTFHAAAVVPDGLIDSVFHAGMVMSHNLALADRAAADVLIEPRLPPVPEVTLANRERIIAAGEQAALAQIERLRALFDAAAFDPVPPPPPDPATAAALCRPEEVTTLAGQGSAR